VGLVSGELKARCYTPGQPMTRSANTPRLRFTLLLYLALLIAAALVVPPRRAALPAAALAAAAVLLVAFACLGRIWCSLFIAGHKDEELVTDGPYALMRHPLYALSLVGGLGLGLASGSLALTALVGAGLSPLLAAAAHREETFLAERHGERWRQYAAATPRWWPRFASWHVPASATVAPRVAFKAFVDAGAFFLLYALVLLATELRDAGIVRPLLELP